MEKPRVLLITLVLLAWLVPASTGGAWASDAWSGDPAPGPQFSTFVVVLRQPVPGDPASAMDGQLALAPALDDLVRTGAVSSYTSYLGINAISVTGDDGARTFLAAWPSVTAVRPLSSAGDAPELPSGAALEAPLAGTAHIRGSVTDAVGVPLDGIQVQAYRYRSNLSLWIVEGSATTAAGSYDIGNLSDGQYKVGFSDPAGNYVPEFYDDQPGLYPATPFMLAADEIKTGINASLAVGGRIGGTVTAGSGASPVGSFGVYAWAPTGGTWDITNYTSTAQDGAYLLGGLPPGNYRVQFKDVYAIPRYGEEWYYNARTRDLAADVPVTAGQLQAGISAVLNGSGRLRGTVYGPDGATRAPGIQVDVYQLDPLYKSWDWANGSLTAADGTYSVDVLAGTYRVKFSDPSAPPYFATECYNDKPDIPSADNVAVTDGGTATANASLALLALPPATNLTLLPLITNAYLEWQPIAEDIAGKPVTIQRYEVWYSASAYFAPGDPLTTRVDRTVTNYTDANALTAAGGRFYTVRALTDRGGYSPASNTKAKFVFPLVSGQ